MKNKQLAKKIDNFLPWWEKEENFEQQVLEILNNNDKQHILEMIEFLQDYYNSNEIIEELKGRLEQWLKKLKPKTNINVLLTAN